jgi:hypothetical protein
LRRTDEEVEDWTKNLPDESNLRERSSFEFDFVSKKRTLSLKI